MRRLLFFPIVWAGFGLFWLLFVYLQFFLQLWFFHLLGNQTGIYSTTPQKLLGYVPTLLCVGASIGLFVALVDFALNHTRDSSGKRSSAAFINALKYGFPILLVGLFLYEVVGSVPGWWSMNRRYHAYPPAIFLLSSMADYIPMVAWATFIIFMTWKTLRYR